MKKLLLSTLSLIVMIGCQKSVVEPSVEPDTDPSQDQTEITIFASSSASSSALSSASSSTSNSTQKDLAASTRSNNTSISAFGNGSSIGVFTQLKSDADAGNITTLYINKVNSRFNYATPTWDVHAKDDKLTYHNTDPIFLYGYYPHTGVVGSSVKQGTAPHIFNFTLATDQSAESSLHLSDLMYCRADNASSGYIRQGEPVSMVFKHQLCKVSIYIRLIDSQPSATSPITRGLLNSVGVKGANIFTKSVLDVLAGTNTIVDEGTEGSVTWTPGQSAMIVPVVADKSVEPIFVTDMMLMPFTAVDVVNKFSYDFEFTEGGKGTQSYNTQIPVYTGNTLPPNAASGNKMRFGVNDHVKITATIDISTAKVNLEASIAPWLEGDNSELEGERS